MKKVALIIAGLIGLAVLVILVLASMQPSEFQIARSTTIEAPPAVVYANIEDLHRHQAWSPWDKLDPNLKRSYSGAPHGKGAVYAWSSEDDEVGAGSMTITDVTTDERVAVRLEFERPFEAVNSTSWTITPAGGGSQVTWSMEGPNTFMGKVFTVFADMDAMIGKDFEKGLAGLKAVAESQR